MQRFAFIASCMLAVFLIACDREKEDKKPPTGKPPIVVGIISTPGPTSQGDLEYMEQRGIPGGIRLRETDEKEYVFIAGSRRYGNILEVRQDLAASNVATRQGVDTNQGIFLLVIPLRYKGQGEKLAGRVGGILRSKGYPVQPITFSTLEQMDVSDLENYMGY